jgi:hypothetical protein
MELYHHDYINKTIQRELEVFQLLRKAKEAAPENPTLRKRTLLYLSNVLLNLSQRIRPMEFQVHVHRVQAQEGTLEITAKGC